MELPTPCAFHGTLDGKGGGDFSARRNMLLPTGQKPGIFNFSGLRRASDLIKRMKYYSIRG